MILKEGAVADRATALSIFRLLGEPLSSFKRLRRISFVASLPKTISGEIQRVELRRREHVPSGAEPPVADGAAFDLAGFTAGELGT